MQYDPHKEKIISEKFAKAAQRSVSCSYDGYMYGFAADKELLEHHVNTFYGEVIAILHPYQSATMILK